MFQTSVHSEVHSNEAQAVQAAPTMHDGVLGHWVSTRNGWVFRSLALTYVLSVPEGEPVSA